MKTRRPAVAKRSRVQKKPPIDCGGLYTSLDQWPNCSVAGCPNKSCTSLNSDKCYPHTISAGLESIEKSETVSN